MPTINEPTSSPSENLLLKSLKEIVQPFIDLVHASRALWGINVSYLLEGLTYFGALALLAIYFNEYVGLNDIHADQMVGLLTAGITLAMLFLGATVDFIGARKALLLSLSFMLIGRLLLVLSPPYFGTTGMWSSTHLGALFGLFWIVLGYGIYQPACYAAVKYFTNEKNAAMGYAMLYALMNLGGFIPGLISPPVRHQFGILGVFWMYVGFTVLGIVAVALILTNRAMNEARAQGSQGSASKADESQKTFKEHVAYYLKHFPLRDMRFLFFIFILIPVQTLFAHNWLTLPQYCSRAFEGVVSQHFEFFVNVSSLLIFVFAPIAAALTSKIHTYNMMIAGTLVMATAPFFLIAGPSIYTLFAFLIVMTLGEAMWSPRFLQWIAEVAPKEMTGIYMGIAQFPWFLTKVITAQYAGWFLMRYCPADTPATRMDTGTMWFYYSLIAVLTPIGLIVTRRWMMKSFKEKHEG
jgi:MFS family permease